MENFIYLVGRADRPETAVIDPAWDVPAIRAAAAEDGRTITHALVTHRHRDHTNGLEPLLELQSAQIVVHRDDASAIDLPGSAVTLVGGGDTIDLGGLTVRCVHTPGHTPGSQCFHVDVGDGALISGDTLFVNACGRCDFPGSDPRQMFDSLHRVLGGMPAETKLFPGHDYGDVPVSSLGRERQKNPYYQVTTVEAFVQRRMPART
jgi:glyoxylase-like metal-dependent hydrolase (beta-lactamase superfamily II)